MSLSKYRRWKRLILSADKRVETNLRVSEISQDMAFPSQSTFCQDFKSYFNMSPTQYRSEKNGLYQWH
ncbi:helix-turn-helix domain-containing protein [Yersinia entomophaga]|uniref:helix-turn-helix domain-containing protein n=1 Tax=Yersinia TaxID=629 RepID=UPI0009004FCD|nr:hypothetical protein B4914_14620 [Yersinia entomophaga]